MRDYDAAFEWLKASMMVNVIYNATDPNVGLELSSDHHLLKCYMGDTGLFVSMAFDENGLVRGEVQQRLLTGRLEVNGGMIYEKYVLGLATFDASHSARPSAIPSLRSALKTASPVFGGYGMLMASAPRLKIPMSAFTTRTSSIRLMMAV